MGRKPTLGGTTQLAIKFASDQVRLVEEWRIAHRVSTPSEAVRLLVWRGLEADGWAARPTPPPAKPAKIKPK